VLRKKLKNKAENQGTREKFREPNPPGTARELLVRARNKYRWLSRGTGGLKKKKKPTQGKKGGQTGDGKDRWVWPEGNKAKKSNKISFHMGGDERYGTREKKRAVVELRGSKKKTPPGPKTRNKPRGGLRSRDPVRKKPTQK